MSNDVNLRTFPRSFQEALAVLYVENQDLSGMTPEQVLDMYLDAYEKICARNKQRQHERMFNE